MHGKDAIGTLKEQWNKYKQKYLEKENYDSRYFETLPFLFQKPNLEKPKFLMTTFDIIFEVESTVMEEQHKLETVEEICCLKDVEQQCSSMVVLHHFRKKPIDPYYILNSLTSQQIRRLISTSYNASFKRNDKQEPSLKISNKSLKSQRKKKRVRSTAVDTLVQRLTKPTEASRMKNLKKVITKKVLYAVVC